MYHLLLLLLIGYASTADVINGTMKLVLVQAIWRHGDRSPTETYHNDKFTVDYWRFGGGGWGQLTPNGMRQQMELGQAIRSRYINGTFAFLSQRYNQQEIFIRSTDKNRTLLSAFSNMVGMYSFAQNSQNAVNFNQPGIDYPAVPGWPVGFVPIPIHTIEDAGDHLLDVDNACPLQDTIWNLAKQTPIVSAYFNRSDVLDLMSNLTDYCGEDINPENLWILCNALKIERQYYPDQFQQLTPWYTPDIFEQIDIVNSQVQDFQNGLGLEGVMSNGLDLGRVIRKIRGGTLINDIYNRMIRKTNCQINATSSCAYTNNLKYFAYSAHDTTLYALFSLLGIAKVAVQPRGYPLYAACAVIEQWVDQTSNKTYFKLIYKRSENDTFNYTLTSQIPGCSGDFCDIDVLRNYSQVYKPDMEMNQWCDYNILAKNSAILPLFIVFMMTIMARL